MTSIHEITFERPAIPRRIEEDAMFTGWRGDLPRLWYLDQRSATRLDSESLFGAMEYAVLWSRLYYRILPPVTQVIAIGVRGYTRGAVTVIDEPIQIAGRTVNYSRTQVTELPEPIQEVRVWRASGSPVNPIPAPPLGADLRND